MEKDRKGISAANAFDAENVIQDFFESAKTPVPPNNSDDIHEIHEEEFPLMLRQSMLRPKQLYYRGKLPSRDYIGVGMVGTRRASNSARELCRRLVKSLQGTKAVVVSGLAQGIDSYCHEAALDAGIPTIAVIAQGLLTPLTGDRKALAQRIVHEGGAIVTEYPGAYPCYRGTFPARNRIISGMSKSVVLVQSKASGGALITADYCLKEGKMLLAVPGDFDSDVASGPNLYLDQGKAKPIFSPESLALVAGLPKEAGIKTAPETSMSLKNLEQIGCNISDEAKQVFMRFKGFRKNFSEIQGECNFKASNILAILTELEIAGLVETRDNFQFYFSGTN